MGGIKLTNLRDYIDCAECMGDCMNGMDATLKADFETKDSGKRKVFKTGMQRDVSEDKPRYDLIWLPLLKRWAQLMGRGAKKYTANNWMKAATPEEEDRFRESALRHMYQYLEGDLTEDHAAAVCFNLAGAEYVRGKLNGNKKT